MIVKRFTNGAKRHLPPTSVSRCPARGAATMTKARIAVVGGRLMGHGIAQVFAAAGHHVRVTDPSEQVRAQILSRISANLDPAGAADALPRLEVVDALEPCVDGRRPGSSRPRRENLELNSRSSSTSNVRRPRRRSWRPTLRSFRSARSMARVERKERALGTHWWNPPFLVPLVEVIRTADTSDAAIARTMDLLRAAGKGPVEVNKDIPGFIGNRLQHALLREAIALVAGRGLRRADRGRRGEIELRRAPCGSWSARGLGPRRRRSRARRPGLRRSRSRPLGDGLALSRRTDRGGPAWLQDGPGFSRMVG